MYDSAMLVDYSGLRLNTVLEPRFRHCLYWLFWPIFGLRYVLLENCHPAQTYYEVWCPLDDAIPFLEEFVIPYVIWYILIVGMHLYTFCVDVEAFRRYSKFLIVAISISTTIYLVFPNCQNLRPEVYPRDNLLTDVVRLLHRMDTNTNVCPSEHVIGSMAVLAAAKNLKQIRHSQWWIPMVGLTFLTSIATVFLKQHSVVDVIAAIPVCMIAYWVCYGKKNSQSNL